MCNDAADTSGQQELARTSSDLSKEQFELQRDVLLPYYMERQANLDKLTSDVTTTNTGIQRDLAAQGADYFDYSKSTFRPVEQSIVAQSMRDSTPEAYARMASTASARSGAAFSNALSASERDLRSRGINPSSGAGVSSSRMAAIQTALAGGAAYNDAYDSAEQRGYARKLDAAGLGRNLAGASAGAYGAATASGAATTGAANDSSRTAGSTIGTPTQYGQLGTQNMGNAIQAQNSVMQAQMGSGTDWGQVLGTAAGVAMMAMSDKTKKKGIQLLSPKDALRGINKTPVSAWQYKDGDDAVHVGPMAQDVRKNMGARAAPGGKLLDLREAKANSGKAVQALQAEVQQLERELKTLSA